MTDIGHNSETDDGVRRCEEAAARCLVDSVQAAAFTAILIGTFVCVGWPWLPLAIAFSGAATAFFAWYHHGFLDLATRWSALADEAS